MNFKSILPPGVLEITNKYEQTPQPDGDAMPFDRTLRDATVTVGTMRKKTIILAMLFCNEKFNAKNYFSSQNSFSSS